MTRRRATRKSYNLQIRVTEEIRQLLARAADLDAIIVSAWVRSVAVRAARDRVAICKGP